MLGGLNDCPLHLSMPLPIRNIYLLGRDQNQGWLLSFSPCLLKSHGAQDFYKSISWQLQPSSAKILKSRHLFHRSPNFWHQPVPCLLGEMSGSIHDLEPLRSFGLDCLQLHGKPCFPRPRIYRHYLHLQTCHLCMLYITFKKKITLLCN